jgi:peptide/nickel transport system permease protein
VSEATQALPLGADLPVKKKSSSSTLTRVARYMGVRILTLIFTVMIGVYLTILIANMGGYVDNIRRGEIRETVALRVNNDPAIKQLSGDERTKRYNNLVALEEKRLGMDKPFIVRSFNYWYQALSLSLGHAQLMSSDSGSRTVRWIILERLPSTLVLFGTANVFLFFIELFIALSLSRQYGSFFDKFFITLSPLSSAPGWFYGIFLILIFAALLHILPFGGMLDAPPPDNLLERGLSMLKHMILPIMAITLNAIFYSVYTWRTFFLIYSSEDYVDVAKAKGLTSRDLERRYILRPTLPFIITNFALTIIALWQGAPIFETVFNWPGIGRIYYQAVGLFDTPVIVGLTVTYAYLLAITVFLLEFIYALVDPRVKVGSSERSGA